MPKQYYTIRDWSGGSNNRRDPRDIAEGDISSTPLTEYIVNRICGIEGSGGYGLFYFESDHSRDSDQTITETKSGTALGIASSALANGGKINFVRVQSTTDIPPDIPESGE